MARKFISIGLTKTSITSKTDEHLRNYDWQSPNGVTVRFRLKNVNVEQNNVKGAKRFFLPVA